MPFATFMKSDTSTDGAVTIDISDQFVSAVQLSITDVVTGNGTVALTAVPSGGAEFQPIYGGTVELFDAGAVLTFQLDGDIEQLKAESNDPADEFSLVVGA